MLVLHSHNLALPRVVHGYFGRQGGVSGGVYAALNCGPGSGDDREKVVENRRRAMDALGGGKLLTLYQIHSPTAVAVTESWEIGQGPRADAMVTAVPGLALGLLTADCAPVLFADAQAGVIGAAHAGWKGALGGVVEAAVTGMEKIGASRARIAAAVGPCIAQASYEVDGRFHAAFTEPDSGAARFFVPSDRPGHFRFDLEAYVATRLSEAGIANIERLSADTYAREADFFSYRRTTHRGETDYGRQLSTIMLKTE